MKNVSRDDNNYHLVTQAGNQTDHSVHGQYWITIFKDCNKINLICPEDNLFLNSPIGSPSQVLAHPSNWKQQNKFYRKILNVSWNVHSASAYRLLIVISSLFFRFISVRILRKLLDTQTEDTYVVIYCCFKEGGFLVFKLKCICGNKYSSEKCEENSSTSVTVWPTLSPQKPNWVDLLAAGARVDI